jgi:hypothetical protein
MPRSGLRVLNIGFGIGMVRVNFESLPVLHSLALYRSTHISKMPIPPNMSSLRDTRLVWDGCGTKDGTIARACAFSRGGGKTSSEFLRRDPIIQSLIPSMLHREENRAPTAQGLLISANLTSCTLIRTMKAIAGTLLS